MRKSKTYLLFILLLSLPAFVGSYPPCFAKITVSKLVSEDTTKKIPKFHILKGNETLAMISAKYKIPQKDIMKWNKLTSAKVTPNQKILLYNPEISQKESDEQLDKNLSLQTSGQTGKSPPKEEKSTDRTNVSAEELQALLNKMNYQPTVISKKGAEIKVIQEQPIPSLIKDERKREKAIADSIFKVREMEEKLEQLKQRARTDSLARIKAERTKKISELVRIKKEKMRADSLARAEKEKERMAALEKARADSIARAEEEKKIKAANEKKLTDSLARVKVEEDKKNKIRNKLIADSLIKVKSVQKKDSLQQAKLEQEKIRKEAEAKLSAANQNPKQSGKTPVSGKTTENPVSKDGRNNVSAEDVAALLSKLNVKTEQRVQYTQQIGIQVSGEDDLNNDQMIRLAFFYDKDLIRAEEREFHSYVVGTKETLKIEEKKDTTVFIKREEKPQDTKPEINPEQKQEGNNKSTGVTPNEKANLTPKKSEIVKPVENQKPSLEKSADTKPPENPKPSQEKSKETKSVEDSKPSQEKTTETKPVENPKPSQQKQTESDTLSSGEQPATKAKSEKTVYGEIEEKGIAYALYGKEIEQDGLKIIHPTAPVGTTIKITNPLVDKSVFAKVCSNELAKNSEKDVIVQMNKKVSEKLGLKNKFVFVTLTYMGYRVKD